jgi:hypothetical protein
LSSQYNLCGGVFLSWCAVGFGVTGGDFSCGWIRYLVVLEDAGVCVAFFMGRNKGCTIGIGVAGGCVSGWLFVFM